MIAVDTNILVACVRTEYPHHDKALEHIRDLAEDSTAWALPWACVHEFLAVVTNPPHFSGAACCQPGGGGYRGDLHHPWRHGTLDCRPRFRPLSGAPHSQSVRLKHPAAIGIAAPDTAWQHGHWELSRGGRVAHVRGHRQGGAEHPRFQFVSQSHGRRSPGLTTAWRAGFCDCAEA